MHKMYDHIEVTWLERVKHMARACEKACIHRRVLLKRREGISLIRYIYIKNS